MAVWYDYELAAGDRWVHVIRDRVDRCAAVVVVMTPDGDQSTWVNREITQAERRRKPVCPLLLKGDAFFRLNDVQLENVVRENMPGDRFVARLRRLVDDPEHSPPDPAVTPPTVASAQPSGTSRTGPITGRTLTGHTGVVWGWPSPRTAPG